MIPESTILQNLSIFSYMYGVMDIYFTTQSCLTWKLWLNDKAKMTKKYSETKALYKEL